jgi:hypothetical protein
VKTRVISVVSYIVAPQHPQRCSTRASNTA